MLSMIQLMWTLNWFQWVILEPTRIFSALIGRVKCQDDVRLLNIFNISNNVERSMLKYYLSGIYLLLVHISYTWLIMTIFSQSKKIVNFYIYTFLLLYLSCFVIARHRKRERVRERARARERQYFCVCECVHVYVCHVSIVNLFSPQMVPDDR